MLPTKGTVTFGLTVTWAVSAGTDFSLLPMAWLTTRVSTNSAPGALPLLKVMASPPATNEMMTPMAPLARAFSTLMLTAQAPRSISATRPVKSTVSARAQARAAAELVAPARLTMPVKPLTMGAQSTVAVLGLSPAMAAGALITSGMPTLLGMAVCATLIASAALDGEPRM